MRVAVCVSGHLRSYKTGYQLFKKNVIDVNPNTKFDFFVSTWNTREWRKNQPVLPGAPLAEIASDFLKMYNPVQFHCEIEKEWDTSAFIDYIKEGDVKKGTRGEHILSMFYKIMVCHSLIGIGSSLDPTLQYDAILRWRTDIGIDDPLIIESPIADSTVYVPKSEMNDWACDVLALGDASSMFKYSLAFASISRIAKEKKVFRPEVLLFHHLNESRVQTSDLGVNWHVIRD